MTFLLIKQKEAAKLSRYSQFRWCHYNVNFHCYTDDTQLYISVEPNNTNALNWLTACLHLINRRVRTFSSSIKDKQDINSPEAKRDALSISGPQFKPKPCVMVLNHKSKSAFFHLRNIARVLLQISLVLLKSLYRINTFF